MIANALAAALRAALFALALVVFVSPVRAQQPSANAIALAKEIITLKGSANMFDNIIPGVIEQIKGLILQTNPMIARDVNDVATRMRTELAARSGEFLTETAKLYAAAFTEPELKAAADFYKSAVGRKLVAAEPQILDRSVANMNAYSEKIAEEILGKFRAELKKKGHDL
jgi:hypothetical protein